jgi:hypothetical protein
MLMFSLIVLSNCFFQIFLLGNFFRIRSAFAFGAQRLARLLDCPKENLLAEFNQFFLNTWDRHGKGHRPDAPSSNHVVQRPIRSNVIDGSETIINYSSSKKTRGSFWPSI